jgi:thiamine pyrophosphokinase
MEKPPDLPMFIQSSIMIIAADGGLHNCIALGIQPNVIIGDLDSIGSDELTAYRVAGVEIIRHPTHKDETDLELALHYALKREINDVIIIAGLGARWDMSVTNILFLANPLLTGLNMRFLDGSQELFLLRAGNHSLAQGHPGDTLSLIPFVGDVSGIITKGLEYPLNDETLQFGTSRGVSNVLLKGQAQIYIKQGLLLCILNKVGN